MNTSDVDLIDRLRARMNTEHEAPVFPLDFPLVTIPGAMFFAGPPEEMAKLQAINWSLLSIAYADDAGEVEYFDTHGGQREGPNGYTLLTSYCTEGFPGAPGMPQE